MPDEKEGLEARYARYKAILKEMTLMNDAFMRNVLKVKECAEYVLQVIMGKPGLQIVDVVIQKDYKNLQGRSAVLDCVARDTDDEQFNVEVQQDDEGASPKRARFHSGLLDMNTLNPGEDFEKLPESYVIFITQNDVLNENRPIYHIKRIISESGRTFEDKAHIIYVNSSIQENTELGRLMHDFHCKNADEMHSQLLASRVRALKETKEGVDNMCREMEKLCSDSKEEGRIEGIVSSLKNLMTTLSLSAEAAMNALKIPENERSMYLNMLAK